jgi:hypothetical protein
VLRITPFCFGCHPPILNFSDTSSHPKNCFSGNLTNVTVKKCFSRNLEENKFLHTPINTLNRKCCAGANSGQLLIQLNPYWDDRLFFFTLRLTSVLNSGKKWVFLETETLTSLSSWEFDSRGLWLSYFSVLCIPESIQFMTLRHVQVSMSIPCQFVVCCQPESVTIYTELNDFIFRN